jgi:uncharacterized membrane protein
VWAIALLTVVSVTDNLPARAILAIPMVLFVSGHSLLRAMKVPTTSLPEHIAYAVGASLAVGIAGGLVLNAIGFLTPLGWAIWFCVVTISASLVAALRGQDSDLPSWPRTTAIRPWHGIAFVLAALITTGAYALAIRDEANQQQFKYVELWMLSPANAGAGRLAVGVRNAEAGTETFDLEIALNDQPLAIFRSLVLAPGETWTREIAVPVSTVTRKAEARLYRPRDNRLYRRVSALVPGD